jgi:hypothetical protein
MAQGVGPEFKPQYHQKKPQKQKQVVILQKELSGLNWQNLEGIDRQLDDLNLHTVVYRRMFLSLGST